MASTWTVNNAVEKIADGEKTDTWGQITNRNFDILDRAASGVGTVDLSGSGAAHSLSTVDGTTGDALSDGMYKVLVLSGATENCTITVSPNDASKFYLVDNDSGHDCTFTQGTGASLSIPSGTSGIIYCDGTGAAANVRAIIDATTLTTLGVTATAAELNYNDITTLGTSEASKVVTADANGVVTFDNGIYEKSEAITSSSGSATLDLQTSTNFTLTLTEDITTMTFSNPAASGRASAFTLKVTQDSTARTITWPSSVDWSNASSPTLSTGSGEVDVFVFVTYDGGTTYYGFAAGQAMG